jgi:hypothetical protein
VQDGIQVRIRFVQILTVVPGDPLYLGGGVIGLLVPSNLLAVAVVSVLPKRTVQLIVGMFLTKCNPTLYCLVKRGPVCISLGGSEKGKLLGY